MRLNLVCLLLCAIILLNLSQSGYAGCWATYNSRCTKYSQKAKAVYSSCVFLNKSKCFRHFSYLQSSYSATCNYKCPSDYGWSLWESWGNWGSCFYSSNNRSRNRIRTCGSSDSNCCYCGSPGSIQNDTENEKCVHGGWNDWTNWIHVGSCSASCRTCGSSGNDSLPMEKYYRTRLCENPSPTNGGQFCKGSATEYTYLSCNTHYCQVDGDWNIWSTWSSWSTCSATCHGGTSEQTQSRSRIRLCNNPAPACQGKDCPEESNQFATKSCNNEFCPVDGFWTYEPWNAWGNCSSTCGTGTKMRVRPYTCTHPKHGGKPCTNDLLQNTDIQVCDSVVKCQVDGGWTEFDDWSGWGTCSHSCGGGLRTRTRSRSCTMPSPLHGGRDCYGAKDEVEEDNCNTLNCPSYCVCYGWGDPHYHTPDGAVIDFQGTCKYTLWKSPTDDECKFNVETKNERRYGDTTIAYTRMIDFYMGATKIRILQDRKTLIDGIWVTIPATTANDTIEITMSGDYVTIYHPQCDIRVQFDGVHHVQVKVSKDRFSGKLMGLCGNCNGRKDDDYRTKSSQPGGFTSIGNSYKVFDDSDVPSLICPDAKDPPACTIEKKDIAKSENSCGYLLTHSSPFKPCQDSKKVNFAEMYSSCEYDVCYSKRANVHCQTLETVALACSQNGIHVKWRRPDFCPLTCMGGFVYKTHVSCTNTCQNPDASLNCPDAPVDGCSCPAKTYLNGGKCVTIDQCGSCRLQDGGKSTTVAVGDTYPKGNCIPSTICELKNGIPTLESKSATTTCSNDEWCTANNIGEYVCTKKAPVHGGWNDWTEWIKAGSCSASCRTCGSSGNDSLPLQKYYRTRLCENPSPKNGGQFCTGSATDYIHLFCNSHYCQVDGAWNTWNKWSSWNTCSASCHQQGTLEPTQTRFRTRLCNNPTPACQGNDCHGVNKEFDTQSCNSDFCPDVDVFTWESWNAWGSCSSTCGIGTQVRVRSYTCTHPKHGERPCSNVLWKNTEIRGCDTGAKCQIDGSWTEFGDWSDWGTCSYSCGGGIRSRSRFRSCTNPKPLHGGRECFGAKDEVETDNCNTHNCPSYCVCYVRGDPHYHTPDGAVIDFQGTCKYTLWKSPADDECEFNVETKNERRNGDNTVAFPRMIDFYMGGTKIRVLQNRKTLIDGTLVTIPATTANDTIEVTMSGDYVTIHHPQCDIRVQFDGVHYVQVKVSKDRFSGKLTGLCGNCNGRTDDDYQTKSGQRGDFASIGNSYKVFDDSDQPSLNCPDTTGPPACKTEKKDIAKSENSCGYLLSHSSPFKSCKDSKKVNFAEIYSSCEYDVCYSERANVHCQTLETVALACSQNGIHVKWRRPDFCPLTCTGGFVYKTHVSCKNTCHNPDASLNCPDAPVDGCTCPPKTYLNGGKCVTLDQCGSCRLQDGGKSTTVAVGDTYPKGNCIPSTRCELKNGIPTPVSISATTTCSDDEWCTVNNIGEYVCTKKAPVDCFWTWQPWTNWEDCSATCLIGVQKRVRTNISTEPKYGGKPCGQAPKKHTIIRSCDTRIECPDILD